MEGDFMSWTKSILAAICCYCLLATAALAEKLPVITALYQQCPASLQLGSQSYALGAEHLYDGSIEEGFVLKPEPVPVDAVEPSFWEYSYDSPFPPPRPLYVKCLYQNIEHYLVLKLPGARRCTFDNMETRMKCE